MIHRTIRILFLFLIYGVITNAQNTDSLKLALKNAKHDTTRCNILNELIENEADDKIWPLYNEQLLRLSEKRALTDSKLSTYKFYLQHLGTALNNKGMVAQQSGDIPAALEFYHKCLKIDESLNNQSGAAISYSNIAAIFYEQGEFAKAIEYYTNGLEIHKELKNEKGMANMYNSFGSIYYSMSLTELPKSDEWKQLLNRAIENYQNALKIYEELKFKKGIANTSLNIGNIYNAQASALEGKKHVKDSLFSIALNYYYLSLRLQSEVNDLQRIPFTNCSIANTLLKLGRINEAYTYAASALKEAKDLGFPEQINRAARTLKPIYKLKNKYQLALEMYELEIQMRDSINNAATKKATIKKQFQYQYEKKAAADSIKNAEEQKVKNAQLTAQQAQLKQEKIQRFALYGGLILVVAFSAVVFNRFKITQRQKLIIEEQKSEVDTAYEKLHEKNKEVMDSINYAARIQRSLITSSKYISKELARLTKTNKM